MKTQTLSCILVFGWLFIFNMNPILAQSSNWPQFRGVNSSGIAAENQDPPIRFGTDQNVIWKTILSEGQSSPCIWLDDIFITGFEEEGKLLKMYCLDRKQGDIKWQRDIAVEEFEKVHAVSSPANATPATDGERVIFYFSSYGLLCCDFDGALLWEFPMPSPESRHGMGSSPIISGDLVILNCFGHGNDPCLLAVNKYDGKISWKHSIPLNENEEVDSYSTPVIYKDQVIIYRSKDLAAYDLTDGDLIWKYAIDMEDAVCTPVIGKNVLYLAVFSTYSNPTFLEQFPDYNGLVAEFDQNHDTLITAEEGKGFEILIYPEKGEIPENRFTLDEYFGFWDHNSDTYIDSMEWISVRMFFESFYEKQGIKAILLDGEGDLSLADLLWGYPDDVPHVTSPLYYDKHVYMVKSGGLLTCFHAESGELLFQERLGASGAYFASPVVAGKSIYLASHNGTVSVIEAGNTFKLLAKNDLEDKISATPAIMDNTLYIRTASSIYAFGK